MTAGTGACQNGRAKCQEICINTATSYKCACRSGNILQSDMKSCFGNYDVISYIIKYK